MRAFLTIFLSLSVTAEYDWLADIVGIDEKHFQYVEGSDQALEFYTKQSYFNNIQLSPDGKHLALQSESDEFTQGILVVDRESFLTDGVNNSIIARLAVDEPGAPDLGIRRLFVCQMTWASNQHILVELCGKTIDFIQGEIFFNIGIFKLFDLETNEFRNFLYPFGKARTRVNDSFQDRYKPATFISRYDDKSILVSVSENRRGFRFAHLRRISLDKKGTDPTGENIHVSDVPCQFRVGYRTNNFCDQPFIFLLDNDKKPALTFSSTKDKVFAHHITDETKKIDVDLEEYGIIGIDGNNLWLGGDPDGETMGLSILNLQTNKIRRITPKECHSAINPLFSANKSTPYAVAMECDGEKDIVLLNNERDAQIIGSLATSFTDKTLDLSSWTDDGSMALLTVSDSASVSDVFLLNLDKGSLEFIASTSFVPKELLHKNETRKFVTSDDLNIYGYLTKPKTEIKKLAVYVHGGPFGPRDYDEFEPFEQYLAANGIAVLKVNFRGSGGYGTNFMNIGYGEWGEKLMDDIATATIATQKELGLESKNTCVVGASYGGSAALIMSYKYPDLYECSLGMMGVYNLKYWRYGGDDSVYTQREDHDKIMEMYLGNDDQELTDISPVFNAEKMKTRILMWHGRQDIIVPIIHTKDMKSALENAGKDYQSFTMTRLGHTYGRDEDMKVIFPVMKKFILNELN